MIGKTISHYKILEKLGEGGMGVVYKARDTKLERDVALKFLPYHAAGRDTDKQRFLHEARAVAALMHQNIAVIHEINEYDGQLFLVLEYIEGKTLKILVGQEGENLSVKQVLDISIQICEGLSIAHEKGIIHRDIKSENIMLTSKGQVKIADFGLAKLKGASKVTRTGSTVGTVAYMSPEQARGEDVDHRSDIYSLGVVLYELLSGKLPFKGDHEAAVIYSLMNEEPAPVTRTNEKISDELRQIVSKALAKEKEDRYQHTNEMLADLRVEKKRLEYMSAGYSVPPGADLKLPYARRSSRKKKFSVKTLLLTSLVISIVAITVLYFFVWQKNKIVEINPAMTFRTLPTPFPRVGSYGLSSDGNWAAFTALDTTGNWNLYFMNISIGIPNRIASFPRFSGNVPAGLDLSPDGGMVAYDKFNPNTGKSEIFLVSTQGGTSKKIVEGGGLQLWSPDGSRIGYVQFLDGSMASTSGKFEAWSVRIDGRDNRREMIDTSSDGPGVFCWSPDGKSIAWARKLRGRDHWEINRRDLESGKEYQLTSDDEAQITGQGGIVWTKNNLIVHSSHKNGSQNLWAVPATGGELLRITNGVGADQASVVSDDCKKILYEQQSNRNTVWLANLDGTDAHQVITGHYSITSAYCSPDGKSIVFNEWSIRGYSICVIDRSGTDKKELTTTEDILDVPKFSPDGKRIAFISRKVGESTDSNRVYLIETTNPSVPKLMGLAFAYYWLSPDSIILYRDAKSFLMSVDGSSVRQIYKDSVMVIPVLKQQYYFCYDYRDRKVYIVPSQDVHSGSTGKKMLPRLQGFKLRQIGPDGSFVLFLNDVGELWKVTLPDGKEELIPRTFPGLSRDNMPFVGYDGKEITYIDAKWEEKLVIIENPFK